jgi:hypothetical protein
MSTTKATSEARAVLPVVSYAQDIPTAKKICDSKANDTAGLARTISAVIPSRLRLFPELDCSRKSLTIGYPYISIAALSRESTAGGHKCHSP